MACTGLIEAGTFLAILAGVVFPMDASLVAISLAVLGLLASFAIPAAPSASPGIRIEVDIFGSTLRLLRSARRTRAVWLSILGISWFSRAARARMPDADPQL